ncbi:hypothetical protein AN643_00970 [Candidatus Epulonipiscioides saccharophilum]|nr:hypothetical protein AN643_00970 [Epulopiscium sp. SCG-B10WGA-EpuloB]
MNDKQTINYLLIIFVVTNLLLGIGNYNKYIKNYTLNQERIKSITTFLAEDGIIIQGELPKDHSAKSSISLIPRLISTTIRDDIVNNFFGEKRKGVTITNIKDKSDYDSLKRVYKKDAETLTFSTYQVMYYNSDIAKEAEKNLSEQKALAYAKEYYKKYPDDLLGKKVVIVYEPVSKGAIVAYYAIYRDIPIFDSYLYMEINDKGVYSSDMKLSEVIQRNANTKEIYAVDQVLFNLHQIINKNTIIKNITLGYARENQEGTFFLTEEATPTYKIEIEGFNKPLFIDAYTNSLK